jgi:thiol-disulfide isomerase/thioredoxin
MLVSPAYSLQINDPAPFFSLRDSTGSNFFMSSYIGQTRTQPVKGIIISFFASYCKPCRHELPVLNSLVEELKKKGIEVVIIGYDEGFDHVSKLLDEIGVDKPIILADMYGKVGKKYGVRYLPMTFFLDADGRVKYIIRGELPDLEKMIRQQVVKLSQ